MIDRPPASFLPRALGFEQELRSVLMGVDGIPAHKDYVERRLTARDLEGHERYFFQPIRELAPQESGATRPA